MPAYYYSSITICEVLYESYIYSLLPFSWLSFLPTCTFPSRLHFQLCYTFTSEVIFHMEALKHNTACYFESPLLKILSPAETSRTSSSKIYQKFDEHNKQYNNCISCLSFNIGFTIKLNDISYAHLKFHF